ncbi:MAG: hypothetical protein WBK51_02000 [Polaromonas sp.]
MIKPAAKPPIQTSAVRMASRSLILGGVACLVAVSMVVGVRMIDQKIRLEQQNSAAELAAADLALQNTQEDRTRLEENLLVFQRLKKAGFVQTPDRLRILEVLENAIKSMRRTVITWEMSPQQSQKTFSDDKAGTQVAQLVGVPMKISAEGVHEEEWLTMLAMLQDKGAGFYAINSCAYDKNTYSKNQTSIPAINVSCNLSWLYVIADEAPPKPP